MSREAHLTGKNCKTVQRSDYYKSENGGSFLGKGEVSGMAGKILFLVLGGSYKVIHLE